MKRRSLVASLFGIMLIAFVSIGATLIAGHSPLLGLDLRGGVEVVLSPHGKVTTTDLNEAVVILNERVDHLGVANSTVERQGRDVVIELPGDKNSQQALRSIGQTAQLYFRPVVCTISPHAAVAKTKTKAKAKNKATTTTTTPPASSSTTKPTPTRAKSATTTSFGSRPSSSTPGAFLTAATSTSKGAKASSKARLTSSTSATTAVSTATTTAPSTPATTTAGSPTTTVAPSPATTAVPSPTTTVPASSTGGVPKDAEAALQDACDSASSQSYPTTNPNNDDPYNTVIMPPAAGSGVSGFRYVLGPANDQPSPGPVLSGKIISSASPEQSTSNAGEWSVVANLNSSGNVLWNNMAAVRNAVYETATDKTNPPAGALEAVELDGAVESAPAIITSEFQGSLQITGAFTESQATGLATDLTYGSLPVRFDPSSVSTISATVGSASLRAGLYAGLGGVVLVLLYMIVYYRALGLVVVLGLMVGGSLLYSIITELSYSSNLALTLSGVTGIIVSIGITVDSYVVYFERLKDEVRKGQTIRSSVERGFARAFRTVLTADLVSFMAALILYLFTVGDVKGFAFTLGLSTLLDVFTAYFFIRPIVILLGRRRTTSESSFLGIARGLGATSTAGGLIR
jgi:preprotein translocase subunit SecD